MTRPIVFLSLLIALGTTCCSRNSDDSREIEFTEQEKEIFTQNINSAFTYSQSYLSTQGFQYEMMITRLAIDQNVGPLAKAQRVDNNYQITVGYSLIRMTDNLAPFISMIREWKASDRTCFANYVDYASKFTSGHTFPPRIDKYLKEICPELSATLQDQFAPGKDAQRIKDIIFYFVLYHEFGHVVLQHCDRPYVQQMELDADSFAVYHLIPNFQYKLRDIMRVMLIYFDLVGNYDFANDQASHPTVMERIGNILNTLETIAHNSNNSQLRSEFDTDMESMKAAMRSIYGKLPGDE